MGVYDIVAGGATPSLSRVPVVAQVLVLVLVGTSGKVHWSSMGTSTGTRS